MAALLIHGVPISCINKAAIQYYVPAEIIVAVLQIEGGKVGTAHKNSNGTIDYGPMQINSIWLSKVAKYGYTRYDLQYNPCDNVAVGTWILSQEIASGTNLWQGVGDYHSHTHFRNKTYRQKVKDYFKFLRDFLTGKAHTRSFAQYEKDQKN